MTYFSLHKSPGVLRAMVLFALTAGPITLAVLPLRAQVVTSTISGTVEDTTGAIIPGATVSIKNVKNGFVRKTTANNSGVFSFPSISSGDYDLTVSYLGFSTFIERGIHLDPQDSRTISDIRLKVGQITETVTVEATMSTLDTGERSSIITEEDIKRLSTEGRDVTELLKILPGSAIATGSANLGGNGGGGNNQSYDAVQTGIGGASSSYAMNGNPLNGVSVRSDGANLDDPSSYGGTTQNINMDMVAEVKISQSNFGADTANGPIVVNAVGKSGGSKYHGELYTYARTYQLNSADALGPSLDQTKIPDHYVYPGFNVGGPVRIPGTKFNKSNKLTFFAGLEEYAQRNTYAYGSSNNAIQHALVPTAAMRTGDFSPEQIMAYLGAPAVSCSSTACGSVTGYTQYQNVVSVPVNGPNGTLVANGNIAPFLDPGALSIVNHFPLPNRVNQGDGFNYATTNLINNDALQGHFKIDLAQTDNDKFYLVYNLEHTKVGIPQAPGYSPSGDSGGIDTPGGLIQYNNSQSTSFNWTRVLSRSLTNEFFASIAYLDTDTVPGQAALLQAAGVGYPYQGAYVGATTQYPQLQDYGYDGLPLALYPDFTQLPRGIYDKRFTPGLGDNLTKVLGSHSIKVGINIERATNNQVLPNTWTNGAISNYYIPETFTTSNAQLGSAYPTTYHNTCFEVSPSGCGSELDNALASFEEGEIQSFTQNNYDPPLDTFWWNTALYYSDDWKVRPNVTFTYGLRVEHLGAWNDAHGIGAAIWNPATANDTATGSGTDTLPGFLWHAIDPKIPTSGIHSRFAFWEPRVGFSWDVQGNGKTTVRGGYGQYRYHDNWNDISYTMASAYGVRLLTVPIPLPNPTTGLIAQGNGLTLASVGTQQLPQSYGAFQGSVGGLDPHDNEEPLTSTYSFTIARQLTHNSVLEVAYVGNDSKYVLNDGSNQGINLDNVNAIPVGTLYKPIAAGRLNPCLGVYDYTLNMNQDHQPVCSAQEIEGLSAVQLQAFRPYANYQNIQVLSHKLYSNYNGLQTTYNKTQGRLTYQLNYTFSKVLGVRGGYNNGIPASAFDPSDSYSPLSYDRTQVFNASYSYQFGDLYHGHRALQDLTNGWQISGITSIQSGPNLQSSSYNSNFGLGGNIFSEQTSSQSIPITSSVFIGTPDVALQPLLICDPRSHLRSYRYINGNCFQLPQQSETLDPDQATYNFNYQNGPFVYPYVHGPAYFNSDLTVIKDFYIREGQNLQFRLEAFNFLNHPLNTFVGSFPGEFQLNYQSSSNANPSSVQPAAEFGCAGFSHSDATCAPYKVGRRVMELALKYSF